MNQDIEGAPSEWVKGTKQIDGVGSTEPVNGHVLSDHHKCLQKKKKMTEVFIMV